MKPAVAVAVGSAAFCATIATAQGQRPTMDYLKPICMDTRTYGPDMKAAALAAGFKESTVQQGARTLNQLQAEPAAGRKISVASGSSVSMGGGNAPIYRLGRADAWYCALHFEPRNDNANAEVQAFVGAPRTPMTGDLAAYLFTIKDGKLNLVPPKSDGEYDAVALRPAAEAGELHSIEVRLHPGRTEVKYNLYSKLSEGQMKAPAAQPKR